MNRIYRILEYILFILCVYVIFKGITYATCHLERSERSRSSTLRSHDLLRSLGMIQYSYCSEELIINRWLDENLTQSH